MALNNLVCNALEGFVVMVDLAAPIAYVGWNKLNGLCRIWTAEPMTARQGGKEEECRKRRSGALKSSGRTWDRRIAISRAAC